jgi:phosphatidylglycerophosphate synthase
VRATARHHLPPRRLGKPHSDGPLNHYIHRPVSGLLSPPLAQICPANTVTGIALVVGLAAAACTAAGQLVGGALALQAFAVLSCADGEVARLRKQQSQLGDLLDTIVDRVVEAVVILAIGAWFARSLASPTEALLAALALLAGVMVLVTSSEKFRSATGAGYPKRAFEGPLAWLSAGSDARLTALSAALILQAAGVSALRLTVSGLALVCWLNAGWRVIAMARHARQAKEDQ